MSPTHEVEKVMSDEELKVRGGDGAIEQSGIPSRRTHARVRELYTYIQYLPVALPQRGCNAAAKLEAK